jgi:hypothetical protein
MWVQKIKGRQGSHTFYTIGLQTVMTFSDLRSGRPSPQKYSWHQFLSVDESIPEQGSLLQKMDYQSGCFYRFKHFSWDDSVNIRILRIYLRGKELGAN